MQELLIEELVKSYREALEDGGAEKVIDILRARKAANVEADGEQSAQLTFDLRTRIEMNNNEIAVDATLNLSEKTKFTFKGESTFTLNFEQQELPLNNAGAGEEADEQ
ncbi:hypothetical protein C5Q97_18995 [Victivallales bacterium CCUG 44730]|nr:hypothetical protein C5Q97_18995 [Victivallales bacterium CCUG 44730]